jgi:hypothetical protein
MLFDITVFIFARRTKHRSALVVCAHQGNSDIKYIANKVGAAEYSASYSSKYEAPDSELLQNLLIKKFAELEARDEPTTDRARLKAVAQSVLCSTQVGAVQACYALLGLPFVDCNRTVDFINPLPRDKVNRTVNVNRRQLEAMDEDASAVDVKPNSQLGRRDAYAKLVAQQREASPDGQTCNVTFHELYTHYGVESAARQIPRHTDSTPEAQEAAREKIGKLPPPPFFKLKANGTGVDWSTDAVHGGDSGARDTTYCLYLKLYIHVKYKKCWLARLGGCR